jgi:hypothetical protein
MKKIILLIIFFITNFSINLFAQQPTEEWVRTYDSPDNTPNQVADMAIDKYSNIYVTGRHNEITGGSNITTVKYNTSGVQLWVAEFNSGGNANDFVSGLALDSSGNCYIAGYYGINMGPFNGIIIKYDSSGKLMWQRTLITPAESEFFSAGIDKFGFIYASGYSGDSLVVIKYDIDGNLIWRNKYFENLYFCYAVKVCIDENNNIYIGGNKFKQSNPSTRDFLITKYNSSGTFLWATTFNPFNNEDWLLDMAVDNSGNTYSAGFSGVTSRDIATIKINTNGIMQWSKFYNGISSATDEGHAIVCDNTGNNIYVTGISYNSSTSTDYVTIKYNTVGDTLWTRFYNGPGNYQDNAMDIAIDNLNNAYITGESTGNGTSYDATTIKYSSTGNQEWVMRWNGSGNGWDGGLKVAVDNMVNVYVSGNELTTPPNNYDYLTIKYSQPVGIINLGDYTTDKNKLYQNYPNPYNLFTDIIYETTKDCYVSIIIYDILGREINSLVNQYKIKGKYKYLFNAASLSSGIYFYTLKAGDFNETKTMILNK